VPLSEAGAEQMRAAAGFLRDALRGEPLRAIYCSGLSRALRSATIIAEGTGLEPVVVPGLGERHFGLWEGMSFDEIMEAFPHDFERWARDPLAFSPVGGETTLQVRDRVMKALREVLDRHDEGPIAIVAHGGVNRVVLCEVLGVSLKNIFSIEQDFACVNVIEMGGDYALVRLVNGRCPTLLGGEAKEG